MGCGEKVLRTGSVCSRKVWSVYTTVLHYKNGLISTKVCSSYQMQLSSIWCRMNIFKGSMCTWMWDILSAWLMHMKIAKKGTLVRPDIIMLNMFIYHYFNMSHDQVYKWQLKSDNDKHRFLVAIYWWTEFILWRLETYRAIQHSHL